MTMFRSNKQVNLTNYTLIIPSASVGNVGQLTCDLLISTLHLEKVGTFWHKALIPIYGPNPFDLTSTTNCTACELYVSETHKLAVMQVRSDLERKFLNTFLDDFKSFVLEHHFTEVFVLTSSFAYEMHDINSGKFRYVTNTDKQQLFTDLNILPMECENNELKIYGSAFAAYIYNALRADLSVTLIVEYATEGDNTEDAVSMLMVLQNCLPFERALSVPVVFPPSWDLVFGRPSAATY